MKWPVVSRERFDQAQQKLIELQERKETITLNQLLERMAIANTVISGVQVTPDNAMKCTAIHGIVRVLTNAIGSYPVLVADRGMEQGQPTLEVLPDHQVSKRLQRPNAIQTSTEFFRMAMKHVALKGNFYAILGAGQTGPISWLRPVENPDSVTLDSKNWATGCVWKVSFDSGPQYVRQGQMLHITSGILEEDGVTGESPVERCKEAIGICLAAEQLIAGLYGQKNVPSLAFTGGKFKDQDTYNLWSNNLLSAVKNGRILLPEGMDIKEVSFKPIDAQLIETIKQKSREIFAVYGVPPHMVADLERATFSNIEEQSLEFVRDVAKPYVILFQQAMTRDLLSESDRGKGYTVRFDMQEATEGKFNDMVTGLTQLYNAKALNPNEIRARLGYNPRDGGDEYAGDSNVRPTSPDPTALGNGLNGSAQDPANLPN